MKENKKSDTSGLKVFAIVMSIGWCFNLIGVISSGQSDMKFAVGTIFVLGLWVGTLFE